MTCQQVSASHVPKTAQLASTQLTTVKVVPRLTNIYRMGVATIVISKAGFYTTSDAQTPCQQC